MSAQQTLLFYYSPGDSGNVLPWIYINCSKPHHHAYCLAYIILGFRMNNYSITRAQ